MLKTLLILAIAFLLTVVLLAWVYQERVVWQPPGPPYDDEVVGVWRVDFVAADGQPLFGYLVPPPNGPAGAADSAGAVPARVLLAFHGNAELAAWTVPWAAEVARRTGWTVFVPEYRGYAGLPGRTTYEGSQHDARAAHAWLRDSLGVRPDRIAIFGFSLGSAVATELATEVRPPVLLLQAPLSSARDMARASFAPLGALWRAIARVHFDTRARVATLDAPVWVAHGASDLVIPTRMGRAVHAAARNPGRLLLVPGAGHNDVVTRGGAAYWSWIEEALRSVE
jgi:pimeloyl-ACP methyl ester carboxylesterase